MNVYWSAEVEHKARDLPANMHFLKIILIIIRFQPQSLRSSSDAWKEYLRRAKFLRVPNARTHIRKKAKKREREGEMIQYTYDILVLILASASVYYSSRRKYCV